jgi:hypothetical protein
MLDHAAKLGARAAGRTNHRDRGVLVCRSVILALGVAACFGLTACGVRGSGKAAVETRQVAEFTEVEASGVLHLKLGLQKPRAVALSGDDNLLPLLTTDVSGGRLVIGSKQPLNPKLDLVATVSAPDVTLVRCSGACEVEVTDVKNEKLTLELSGAGSISANGTTKNLVVDVSGAGRATAETLRASNVTARLSGAGEIKVGPADKLDATVSGAGAVTFDGNPAVTQHVSGAGSVKHK